MKRELLFLLCLPLLLGGCTFQGREPGQTAVVGVLGVERQGESLLFHAAAEGRSGKDPLFYTGQGETCSAGVEALRAQGTEQVNCSHVEHILLEETAAGDLPNLLDYALQDPEQSTESNLWVVRGLSGAFSPGFDPASRMKILKQAGKEGRGFFSLSLRQAAAALAEGEALLLPGLTVGKEGLSFSGYALYQEGKIVGWLTGDDALGAALLAGKKLITVWSEEPGQAVQIKSRGCRVTPVWENGTLSALNLRCRLMGTVTQGRGDREEVTRQMELQAGQWMSGALARMQALSADGAGLKRRAGLKRPFCWDKLARTWDAAFPLLTGRISVQATLERA